MASACTGRTDGEIHALEPENCAEVHRHGGVHCLKEIRLSEKFGVVLFEKNFVRFNHRFGRGIVAENAATFVCVKPFLTHSRHLESLERGHIGIFRLFRKSTPQVPVNQALELRFRNNSRKR